MGVTEIYERSIKPLPAADRLRLAAIILNDIPPQSVADYRDDWSDADLKDFTNASWRQAKDEEGAADA